MALTPGTLLGPYEVLAPLGAGGMGEVYRVPDAKTILYTKRVREGSDLMMIEGFR